MKKLQSFALYALATPVLALSAGSALAQSSTGFDADRTQLIAQRDQGARQGDQGTQREGRTGSKSATDRDQSRQGQRGHMSAAPAGGQHISDLMGKDVKTADGESVGSVGDMIIDQNGQIVAIIVGVGGFLGMGEKNVAIGWDNVTRAGLADDDELRVDVTRQDLRNAPEFEKRD